LRRIFDNAKIVESEEVVKPILLANHDNDPVVQE